MDYATQASIASAVGQWASVLVSVGGLGFVGWQIKEARKVADLQTLQTFFKDARDHEQALLKATNMEAKEQAFVELLNFLEASAAAVNGGLLPKVSQDIVSKKLRDSIAVISEATEWHDKFLGAVTTHDTFEALRHFMKKNKGQIEKIIKSRAAFAKRSETRETA